MAKDNDNPPLSEDSATELTKNVLKGKARKFVLIVKGGSHRDIHVVAQEQGMRSLRDQAIRLVAEGDTTIAEVLRTVYVL